MSNGFEPGALALIKKANNPDNLGKIVELVFSTSTEEIHYQLLSGEAAWTPNPSKEKCWVVRGDLVALDYWGCKEATDTSAIPETWLMPLKGDFTDEEEVEDVLLSLSN